MIRSLSLSILNERFAQGVQDLLTFTSVPAGAESLLGKQVVGAQITIAGNYVCAVPIGGLQNKFEAHLTATNNSGTMPTTSGGTTFADQSTQKNALTGIGLMVTATRQTVSLATAQLDGSRVCNLIINLPAASSCTFTQAEFNGK